MTARGKAHTIRGASALQDLMSESAATDTARDPTNPIRDARALFSAERLELRVIWAYALARVGVSIMGVMFGVYLMKYATDVLLIAPAVMGTLIAASRLWDGVTDPVIGYLSDRTRSRFGRRRVWMFGAAVPMALGTIMIWAPPAALEGALLVTWMAVALIFYETASTAFFIPHGALGAELTGSYHERTRLFGYVHMIGAIGTLLGMGALQLMTMADDKRAFAFSLSFAAAAVIVSSIFITTRMLPEQRTHQGRGSTRVVGAFTDILRNRHARLLLLVFAIEMYGLASIYTLTPYLVSYVFPLEALLVLVMATYAVPTLASAPLWMWAARRFGKQRTWTAALMLSALPFVGFYLLETPGVSFWILTFVTGFLAGCGAVVPPAIQADVIDFDELKTGERKEGAYLAMWNLIRKCSASLCALLTGFVLELSGFVPNAAQSPEAQHAIKALFGLFPASCYLLGGLLFLGFTLNEQEHGAVQEALRARQNR
jgi:GPH family glycoside/pentoside/hexuronide:cation symporter